MKKIVVLLLGWLTSTSALALTPMVGAIHSWKFDQDVDVAAGFYLTIGQWNLYLWGNDFLKSHPRIIVGIDFAL